jgi:ABC-type multidrug transport system ATPase subunit
MIMEWPMPNESQIFRMCRRVLILKKTKKIFAGQFVSAKYRLETYCWTQKLNREDYEVHKYLSSSYTEKNSHTSTTSRCCPVVIKEITKQGMLSMSSVSCTVAQTLPLF